jgi:hypothetical protein
MEQPKVKKATVGGQPSEQQLSDGEASQSRGFSVGAARSGEGSVTGCPSDNRNKIVT